EAWPITIDEPAAGSHADGVGQEKGGDDQPELVRFDAVALDNVHVAGGLHADAVEPAHEAEREQQGHDPPADPGGPLVNQRSIGFTHISLLSARRSIHPRHNAYTLAPDREALIGWLIDVINHTSPVFFRCCRVNNEVQALNGQPAILRPLLPIE